MHEVQVCKANNILITNEIANRDHIYALVEGEYIHPSHPVKHGIRWLKLFSQRIDMLTLGSEIFHDEALRKELQRDSSDASAIKAGIALAMNSC